MKQLIGITFLLLAGAVPSADANDRKPQWTWDQVARSVVPGTRHFLGEKKQEAYDAIENISFVLKRFGADMYIRYKDGEETKTVKYYCHYHDFPEIDCH